MKERKNKIIIDETKENKNYEEVVKMKKENKKIMNQEQKIKVAIAEMKAQLKVIEDEIKLFLA